MQMLLALVALSVSLSAPFGEAEARAVTVDETGIVLEVEVEVEVSALVVLVRGAGRIDELPPVALTELGSGRWGGIVEIPVVDDILLGFEIIRPDGGSAIVSELSRLSELGVDPAVLVSARRGGGDVSEEVPATSAIDEGPSTAPIWLGIGAGAAALALLLIWWLGDRPAEGPESSGPDEETPDPDDAVMGGDSSLTT